MVNKLQTIMDRVLIRLEDEEVTNQRNIILTDDAKSKVKKNVGIVESIGEQVHSVKIGDKVFFHAFSELPALENGVVVVRERSLLGVLDN